jgi:HAE1 family hydrophobic/amphiphilic exporter-1
MLGRLIAGVVLRPVTATVVTIAVVLFGLVALSRTPVDLLPNLSYPSITVEAELTDAAPAEVETLVTRPIEELVGAVQGVVSVESISREGRSEVILDFAWGTTIDTAMADVREKLDRVRLPIGSARPRVLRYDPAQSPVLRLALVGPPGARLTELRTLADKSVKRALEKQAGVAAVELHGGDEEEVRVAIDPARLAALGLDGSEIVSAITRDNVNQPGGGITEGDSRYLLRTVHEARTPEALAAVVVRSSGDARLRLSDVATVERVPVEREESALVDGREAIELSVFREGDANTVSVARAVTSGLETLRLPAGHEIVVLRDQAQFIEAAVDEVADAAAIGGGLAVLVLLFFLRNLRSTLAIGVSIPVSVLAAFVPLRMLDVSMNLMSLGGIALGVGMLVDNGIVTLEAIARRREQSPDLDRRDSAIAGATDIATAVVASTFTTVAVFLPMAFVEDVAGQLVRDLAFAVSFSILSSMVVSLTLLPALEGLGGGPNDPEDGGRAPLASLVGGVLGLLWRPVRLVGGGIAAALGLLSAPLWIAYEALERSYPLILRGALRVRTLVLLGAAALFFFALMLGRSAPQTLLPEVTQGEFHVQLTLPHGSALPRTSATLRALASAIDDDERVAVSFARAGSMTAAGSAAGATIGPHLGQLDVRLEPSVDPEDRATVRTELVEKMRAVELPEGTRFEVGEPALIAFDAPIEVRVFSEDGEASAQYARDLLPGLQAIDGLDDIAPDDLEGRPEVRIEFDRDRLSRLGSTVELAASAVQRAIQGELAGVMHADDKQLDIRVQLPRVDRSHVEDVRRILVAVVDGVPVPLAGVATVHGTIGPAEIRRLDGRRGLRIRARPTTTDLASIGAQVDAVIAETPAPATADGETIEAVTGGQAAALEASLLGLAFTAALSVFLVYVVMASSFESLHHPFLIIFTVPLALIGVVLGVVFVGLPISALVGIGTIILGGIVVNNAIVLVDAVNRRRGQGDGVDTALIGAGAARLRPIVMTTLTTVLGLVPLALGGGDGAGLRQPLAVTVIGGLAVSTALTLVVIPCAYALAPGRRRAAWMSSTSQAPATPDSLE